MSKEDSKIITLDYYYSTKSKRYSLKKYQSVLKAVNKWIKNNVNEGYTILNDDDLKVIRKKITLINNTTKDLDGDYKAVFGILMGDLLAQKKELGAVLDKASSILTKQINDYKASKVEKTEEKVEEPKVYKIEFETTDLETYNKVKEFIEQLEKEKK